MEQMLYVLSFCLYVAGQPCEEQGSVFETKEICEAVREDNRELADLPGTDADAEYRVIKDCVLEKHLPVPVEASEQ